MLNVLKIKLDWLIHETITQAGFMDFADLFRSLFQYKNTSLLYNISMPALFAWVAAAAETTFGIPVILFIAFVLLLCLEFWTGIEAALKEGKQVESRKMGRMAVKVVVYSVLLFIVNSIRYYAIHSTTGEGGGVAGVSKEAFSYLYSGIYWLVFNLIILQLLRSVTENFVRMGYTEVKGLAGLLGMLNNEVEGRAKKTIDLIDTDNAPTDSNGGNKTVTGTN